jgi:hypothetical protein
MARKKKPDGWDVVLAGPGKKLKVGDRVVVQVLVPGKDGNATISRFGRVHSDSVVGVLLDGDLNPTAIDSDKMEKV